MYTNDSVVARNAPCTAPVQNSVIRRRRAPPSTLESKSFQADSPRRMAGPRKNPDRGRSQTGEEYHSRAFLAAFQPPRWAPFSPSRVPHTVVHALKDDLVFHMPLLSFPISSLSLCVDAFPRTKDALPRTRSGGTRITHPTAARRLHLLSQNLFLLVWSSRTPIRISFTLSQPALR